MVKDLFDMADRYASQEEAMAAENDDRPRQNQKKDNAESSKQKGQNARAMTWWRQPSAADHLGLLAWMTSLR